MSTLRFVRAARLLLLALAMLSGQDTLAYSFGAPVCEIDASTMSINMGSSVLSSPGGWSLKAPSSYTGGTPITITLAHVDASRSFRGLLLWATTGGAGGLGRWTIPAHFQNPGGCLWSLTHASAGTKTQQSFAFDPPAAGTGPLVFHAFLVEDCGGPAGSCRTSWVQVGSIVVAEAQLSDSVPDAFAFATQSDVAPGAVVTSNAVTISGINTAAPVNVTGGQYSDRLHCSIYRCRGHDRQRADDLRSAHIALHLSDRWYRPRLPLVAFPHPSPARRQPCQSLSG